MLSVNALRAARHNLCFYLEFLNLAFFIIFWQKIVKNLRNTFKQDRKYTEF